MGRCLPLLFFLYILIAANSTPESTVVEPASEDSPSQNHTAVDPRRDTESRSPANESASTYVERIPFNTPTFWLYVGICSGLVVFAGLMSGLTVGFLSIDELVLELKMKSMKGDELRSAEKIMSILQRHHLVLVTLLIANSAAMEALPVFLNHLVNEAGAIIISVTAVLIFGEVIPQALCTGPSQLKIASALSPLVSILIILEGIIAYPLSIILDKFLGPHEPNRFENDELKAIIELHTKQESQKDSVEGEAENAYLSSDQAELISGAIDLSSSKAIEKMTPISQMVMISNERVIDQEFFQELKANGFSRYPIYRGNNRNDVCGILLVKKLLGVKPLGQKLKDLDSELRKPFFVPPATSLSDLLLEFTNGRMHMAIVANQAKKLYKELNLDKTGLIYKKYVAQEQDKSDTRPEILGAITLEKVIEKAIGDEILDEKDFDKENRVYAENIRIPTASPKPPKIVKRPEEEKKEVKKIPPVSVEGLAKGLSEVIVHENSAQVYDIIKRSLSKKSMKSSEPPGPQPIVRIPSNSAAKTSGALAPEPKKEVLPPVPEATSTAKREKEISANKPFNNV